jgi:TetR/AcrR family transcriptional repressor of nem operon
LKGHEATSVQDLVDRLGIGRGSIYDTFGSKHQLYLAALNRYLNEDSAEVDLDNLPLSAKEIIVQMMQQQVDEAPNNAPDGGCLMVTSAMELGLQDKAVGDRIKSHIAAAETLFVQLLTRAQVEGEIPADRDVQALQKAGLSLFVTQRLHRTQPAGVPGWIQTSSRP